MTHKAAAKFTVAQHAFTQRLRDGERGGPGMEYVGMIVVAAMLVGIIYTAINGAGIDGSVKGLITKIFSGGGAAGT